MWAGPLAQLAEHPQVQGLAGPRRHREARTRPASSVRSGAVGRTRAGSAAAPGRAPGSASRQTAPSTSGGSALPRAGPPRAAHLEDVGEVGGEAHPDPRWRRRAARSSRTASARSSPPARGTWCGPRAAGPGPARCRRSSSGGGDVRVLQVGQQQLVGAAHRRGQHDGPLPVQAQLELRQEAGPLVEHPLLAQAVGLDVAGPIEHAEGIVVLEHPVVVVAAGGGGPDVVVVGDLDDVFIHMVDAPGSAHPRTGSGRQPPLLQRPFRQALIDRQVVLGHARGGEARSNACPAHRRGPAPPARSTAASASSTVSTRTAAAPVLEDLRDRAAAESEHRRATCQRLDHDQPEGLGPVDREQQPGGVAQELPASRLR